MITFTVLLREQAGGLRVTASTPPTDATPLEVKSAIEFKKLVADFAEAHGAIADPPWQHPNN